MKIKFKKCSITAVVPKYQTVGASGFDFHANEEITIKNGQILLIKTGFAVELPEDIEIQIRPRSSLALKHGITVWNAPGTIDSDYREEIGIILCNGGIDYKINIGDRIAQGVLCRVEKAEWEESEELSETERGVGAYGSTGV